MGRRFNGSQGRVRRALSWEFVALPDASLALRTPKHKGTLQDWAGELADAPLGNWISVEGQASAGTWGFVALEGDVLANVPLILEA